MLASAVDLFVKSPPPPMNPINLTHRPYKEYETNKPSVCTSLYFCIEICSMSIHSHLANRKSIATVYHTLWLNHPVICEPCE